ncbi:hypothetical protein WAI453_002075 [Rhynchosporium graminicola]
MVSSLLTALILLLPLIAAQESFPVESYPVETYPASYPAEVPVETSSLGPGPEPFPTYSAIPQPEPEPTGITVTYDGPVTSTYPEGPPIITNPACNPEAGDCPPCVPGEGDCPYPATSTTSPPIITNPASESPSPSPSTTCICYSAPCAPCNGTPIPYPQTIYTTILHTITSCAPDITSCSPGHVTTSLISLSTITSPIPVYATTYTTAYVDICPTGITTKTYTITRTCTEEKCSAPTTIPEHFTTTTKVCEACPDRPTLTITCPVESETGTWSNSTTIAAGTGTGKPSGSNTGAGGAGCGYGGLCPSENGNETGHFETGGAESAFGGGVKVLAVGGLVGLLGLML